MTCAIICGGLIDDYNHMKKYLERVDLVIAVDGGARHCSGLDTIPHFLVGDFDSISEGDHALLTSAGTRIIRYPVEKDMTDSELAIQTAIDKGCTKIVLLGAIGSRFDHTISNLFLLKKLTDSNIEGVIANEKNEIRMIKDRIAITAEEGAYLTLLPAMGDAAGVSTEGLYYPLENAVLKAGVSLGVSNRFTSDTARITVRQGYLLVIRAKD